MNHNIILYHSLYLLYSFGISEFQIIKHSNMSCGDYDNHWTCSMDPRCFWDVDECKLISHYKHRHEADDTSHMYLGVAIVVILMIFCAIFVAVWLMSVTKKQRKLLTAKKSTSHTEPRRETRESKPKHKSHEILTVITQKQDSSHWERDSCVQTDQPLTV